MKGRRLDVPGSEGRVVSGTENPPPWEADTGFPQVCLHAAETEVASLAAGVGLSSYWKVTGEAGWKEHLELI